MANESSIFETKTRIILTSFTLSERYITSVVMARKMETFLYHTSIKHEKEWKFQKCHLFSSQDEQILLFSIQKCGTFKN